MLHATDSISDHVDVFGRVVTNGNSAAAISLKCWSEVFSIPPHSSFLLSDITKLSLLVDHTGVCSDVCLCALRLCLCVCAITAPGVCGCVCVCRVYNVFC